MQRAEWTSYVNGESDESNTSYGLGFFLTKYGDRYTFGHSGGFPGCITRSMADGEDGIAVSVLTNAIDGPAEQILSGIYRILNYFAKHLSSPPKSDLIQFEGSYASLWGVIDILAEGDGLISVPAGVWEPFTTTDRLTRVDGEMFSITKTGSGGSEGEHVYFNLEGGRVTNMVYQGKTFWPQSDWDEKMAKRTEVRLPD